jgi:hypothetical protein
MGIPFESKKRFRVNPIEIAIFSVISLIFVKSGYSLLYAHDGFDPAALTASAQDPLAPVEGRSPASVAPVAKTFSEVKIGCDDKESPAVSSNKIRLIGNLCAEAAEAGAAVDETPQNVKKISVVNTSAKVAATVFPDYTNKKFSTDYISLAQGKNLIYVQYEFKDGKTLGHEFSIMKN